ncbi:TPA: homoserine dehydrogenase, partial [Candidatus Bathyarchaeota archaeon]|nr:homoserine dehydrogenase [Candidatus Bathyarchaeota archaeon]
MLRIALLGFGSVGRGFATVLLSKMAFLRRNYLVKPTVVAIVDTSGAAVKPDGVDLRLALKVKAGKGGIAAYPNHGRQGMSGVETLDSVDSDVIVEVTPTNIVDGEPGMSHILRAIDKGRHVITSNKGPLALAFRRLTGLARRRGVEFRYTATVGGATPVISLAKRCLAGNDILSIRGILNSTTNYVLTQMTRMGLTMEEALERARPRGIVEKDPTYDVMGIDTACKIVILANALMNRNVTYGDVREITGIQGITREDIEEAMRGGFAIKLIGTADDRTLRVRPEP